jgi:hypothetical protein
MDGKLLHVTIRSQVQSFFNEKNDFFDTATGFFKQLMLPKGRHKISLTIVIPIRDCKMLILPHGAKKILYRS